MIVVDTSTLIKVLLGTEPSWRPASHLLAGDPAWAAPQHQPVEVLSVVRGLLLGKRISETTAAEALTRWSTLAIQSLPLNQAAIERIWSLRANLTPYDAAYVALAEQHGLPLVTSDRKLVSATGIRCELRLI